MQLRSNPSWLFSLRIKSIAVLSVFLFVTFHGFDTSAQSNYYLFDPSDTSTFSITGGKLTGAYWGVDNDSQSLTTTPFVIPTECDGSSIPFMIRINQSGNMDIEDSAWFHYYCGGTWFPLDSMTGLGLNSVESYYYNTSCPTGDTFAIRITYQSNDGTEKWQLRDGDISVGPCEEEILGFATVNLTAQQNNKQIVLHLYAITQLSMVSWSLEKSIDGEKFYAISEEQLTGQLYELKRSFIDYSSEQKIWFRLKVTDLSGDVHYSHLVVVSAKNHQSINIYYRTSNNSLVIDFGEGDGKLAGSISIFSLSGQKITQFPLSGNSTDAGIQTFPLSGQNRGMYIALLESNGTTQTYRYTVY